MGPLFFKWMLIVFLPLSFLTAGNLRQANYMGEQNHPIHVSVTEINHNAKEQTVEISCKIFVDDFEKALGRNLKQPVDLLHPKNKTALDKAITDYINSHLSVTVNEQLLVLNYIGYEVENDAVYIYFEAGKIVFLKKAEVTNTLLHDLYTDQTEIVHVVAGGSRKSVKLDYPVSTALFQF